MSSVLIQGGVIVTMNKKREIVHGDIRLKDGTIAEIAPHLQPRAGETIVDAQNGFVIPGLIQAHTHLCQTLFRGWADDLELLQWLRLRIWPLEKAHDEASLRASARLGLLEMQLAGTTSILDMGTVDLHEAVFEEAEKSGMRYWGGNCLMDRKGSSGPLFRSTEDTLAYSRKLIDEWHGRNPLIHYAVSPRFVISCTEKLLLESLRLQREHQLLFHTHASENKDEVALVKKRTGLDNVRYLRKIGALGRHTVLAHGIHLTSREISDIARARTAIVHCPSSNLKLASGIAKVAEYRRKKITVALGADGAPCNNMMDPFMEMRLAALLQKPLFGGKALPARDAFEMATLAGAKALGAEDRIGSLEPGKRADVVIVSRKHPAHCPVENPYSALVYSSTGRDVSHVWINGRPIVADGRHLIYDHAAVMEEARLQLDRVRRRAKLRP